MKGKRCIHSRAVTLAAPLASVLLACSTVVGNPKRPTGGGTSPSTPSVIDDATAQSQAVSLDLATILAALSDGSTGGDTINSYGLGLMQAFNEARTCTTAATPAAVTLKNVDGSTWQLPAGTQTASLTRLFTGDVGRKSYAANADGSPSGDAEVWYPGPYYGLANVQAATDANGALMPTAGSVAPAIPAPAAGAPDGSSGQLGSVGWRSNDGSWTGAPVWQVRDGFIGEGPLPVSATEGMVMYYTANLPVVTAAATAPSVGGAYAPTKMLTKNGKTSPYSVLGIFGNGSLPSFTGLGRNLVNGQETAVGQAGTITTPALPAVMYNPPSTVGCAPDGVNPAPGWRFSQNIAGLTRLATTKTTYVLSYRKGSSENTADGSTTTIWADPALAPPVKPATGDSAPYFDENAGTFTANRSLSLGSADKPNTYTSLYTAAGGAKREKITNKSYTSVPFTDSITRDLNKGFGWVTRTVSQGTMVSTHYVGDDAPIATISTAFAAVVFQNDGDQATSCVPKAGVITATITPSDATKQTTVITLKFGASAGVATTSGVTATVSCAGGAAGANNCAPAAEADDPDFAPSGCNF